MRLFVCLLMVVATGAASADQPQVEVFLPPVSSLDLHLALQRAVTVATQAYAEIGVRIIWRSAASSPSGCSHEPLHHKILVAFGSNPPRGMHVEAAGFANPYATEGPCVTLFFDQLGPASKNNPVSTGFLLGYVLAHEIGHVLEGVARHSETGLMKSAWSTKEIMNMEFTRMHFSEFDARFILDGFAVAPAAAERPCP